MRGHWISTTRKLNKHYQYSGGGPGPTPQYYTWGIFFTGGCGIPGAHFRNDITTFSNKSPIYPSGSGEPYCLAEGASMDYDYYYGTQTDFCQIAKNIGMRNVRDGSYYPVPVNTIPYSESGLEQAYEAGVAAHQYSQVLTERTIAYKDFGMRYTKFFFPRTWFAPGYYYDYSNTVPTYELYKAERPVATNWLLTARSCKNATYPCNGITRSYAQMIRYQQYYQNDPTQGGLLPGAYNYKNIGNSNTVHIYDKELNGEAYIEWTNCRAYEDDDNQLIKQRNDLTFRLYSFIHDNAYYIDQRVHVIDPTTGLEMDNIHVWLTYCNYPRPLYPYCLRGVYMQPERPSSPLITTYPTFCNGSAYGQSNLGVIEGSAGGYATRPYDGLIYTAGDGVIRYNNMADHPCYAFVEAMDERTFWSAQNAWANAHGASPYTPPLTQN